MLCCMRTSGLHDDEYGHKKVIIDKREMKKSLTHSDKREIKKSLPYSDKREMKKSPPNSLSPNYRNTYYGQTAPGKNMYITDTNGNRIKPLVKQLTNVNQALHVKLLGLDPRHSQRHAYKAMHLSNPPAYHVKNASLISRNIPERVHNKSEINTKTNKITLAKTNDRDSDRDTDSLSEAQRRALKHLDDTLNSFHIEDIDEKEPVIVADILPYGVFEKNEPSDPSESSDDQRSSRSSSISIKSESSVNGIISMRSTNKAANNRDRKTTSVSFQLPEGHVDKPYSPMMATVRPPPPQPFATICVSDAKGAVWYSGTSNVYVDDKPGRSFRSNSFKGSFKNLIYGKYSGYSSADFNGYSPNDRFGAVPKIAKTIESFETLNETSLNDGQAPGHYKGGSITRRNTMRY